MAVLVGGALSLSGSVYQGIFKNPLVSPDLLGVSLGRMRGRRAGHPDGFRRHRHQFMALGAGLAVLMTTMLPRLLRNRSTMVLVLFRHYRQRVHGARSWAF